MASRKYIEMFLKQLDEFLDKLEARFPEEKDIQFLQTVVAIAQTSCPEEIIKQYHRYVFPYKKSIENRDENFLLSQQYSLLISDLEERDGVNTQHTCLKIDYFKNLFKSERVDKDTKNAIWEYLRVLNKIIEKIISTNELNFASI